MDWKEQGFTKHEQLFTKNNINNRINYLKKANLIMTIFLARHRIRLIEGHKYSMVDHSRMEMRNLCKNIVVNVILYRYHTLDKIKMTFLALKSFKRECVHILFWTISSVQIFRSLTIQSHRMDDLGLLWGVLIPFLCQSVHFLITFKSPRHVGTSKSLSQDGIEHSEPGGVPVPI